MAKGVSVKFKSYNETIPRLLDAIKFNLELKKYSKIILKPYLTSEEGKSTPGAFIEQVLRYCLTNKNPAAEIFIADGADGVDTMELFSQQGYKDLAERYSIGLVDLNDSEVQEIEDGEFLRFTRIFYPKILLDSFVIPLPKLSADSELEMISSLSTMIGAYPSSHYTGFFSSKKSKIRKYPMKYVIHDILKCKMPQFTLIDASEKGVILAGNPLEMDKQAAKLIGKDPRQVGFLRLIEQSFQVEEKPKETPKDTETMQK